MLLNAKNLIKLGIIGFGLWFFFAIFTPWFENFFPAWQRYNRIAEEKGLDSGALYYSNVPVYQDAEEHLREATRQAMEERRQKYKNGN